VDVVLSNWKMYPTVDEARSLLATIQAGLLERPQARPRVIVCPPAVALGPLGDVRDDRVVHLGAQHCHWEDGGPYTGEISPRMLRGLADYVMVGHRDRRAAGQTDAQVARTVAAVVRNGLVPILFVETERQLRAGLSEIDPAGHDVLVVYEPAWAIGADRAAPAEHVRQAVERLKAVMSELGAGEPKVLYGGTVNERNVDELAAIEELDGLGATRAGLDPAQFLRIIDRVTGRGG
jgi:triosephosphate isomerase (TIM)